MKFSLLDRSRTRLDETDALALQRTVERAQRAERLGFHRFWVAEHHAVPGIASSAPTVLLAAVAASTDRIRVGTGGVMLPNHNPLVVAEQFAILMALFPGRVDVGLGRSLGFTKPVREALGRTSASLDEFAHDIDRVRDYLAGAAEITMRPRLSEPSHPPFVLAIKDGLEIAARLGLPVVVGGPLVRRPDLVRRYFDDFVPSTRVIDGGDRRTEPYLVLSADIMVADTTDRARELLLPEAWAQATARERGDFPALYPLDTVKTEIAQTHNRKKLADVDRWFEHAIFGTVSEVRQSLTAAADALGASEILVSASTSDPGDLAEADRAISELWGR